MKWDQADIVAYLISSIAGQPKFNSRLSSLVVVSLSTRRQSSCSAWKPTSIVAAYLS